MNNPGEYHQNSIYTARVNLLSLAIGKYLPRNRFFVLFSYDRNSHSF